MRQENPVVPDGGWGWVIVACSFVIHMFVVGSLYALSVLYVSWLETFKNSKGYTSWILSLAVAVMFGIGPLPGLISRRFSNRVTVVIGGLLMFLGFFVSVFAQSVLHLICSIGIVTGIGAGCCYLPSVSMIAMYFNSKRSIAMGISSAGLGVGAFLMPLYLNWMVENYGWRGCMLILSGLSLNMCVLGFLMRPLKPRPSSMESHETDDLYTGTMSSLLSKYTTGESDSVDEDHIYICEDCNAASCRKIDESSSFIGCNHRALPSIEITLLDKKQVDKEIESCNLSRSHNLTKSHFLNGSGEQLITIDNNNVHIPGNNTPTSKHSLMHLDGKTRQTNYYDIGGSLQCLENGTSGMKPPSNKITASLLSLSKADNSNRKQLSPSTSLTSTQMMMAGGLYSAIYSSRILNSMMSLHSDNHPVHCDHRTSSDNHHDSTEMCNSSEHSETLGKQKAVGKSKFSEICGRISSSMNVHLKLFRNGKFVTFCISNFLTNLSFFMPVLYMVDRAIDEGISKNGAAILVSIYGAGNIFGKLFFGWLADRGIVNRLVIYIGCLVMAGLATCLSPLCGGEQALHSIYSFSFGCFIGSYCTLYPIVTVDLVGLEFVDESVGVILSFMGVATAFGSPLAGWIFDMTGSYTMAYALHGVFILISATMMIPAFIMAPHGNKH